MTDIKFINPKVIENNIYSYDMQKIGITPSGLVPSLVFDCDIKFSCDLNGVEREASPTSFYVEDVEFEIFKIVVNPYDCDLYTAIKEESLEFFCDMFDAEFVEKGQINYGSKIRILKELDESDFNIENIEYALDNIDLSKNYFYPKFKRKGNEFWLECYFVNDGISFECSVKSTNPIILKKINQIEWGTNRDYNVYYNADYIIGSYEDDRDAINSLIDYLYYKKSHGDYDEIVWEDCFVMMEYWTIISNEGGEGYTGENRIVYVADPNDI